MSISLIILLPLIGALLNGSYAIYVSSRGMKPSYTWVSAVGVLLPFASFFVALRLGLPLILHHADALTESVFAWITVGKLEVNAALLLDRLSVIMSLVVTGVGSLIHLYSMGYMKGDEGYARYFAYLNLFLSSMLILVLADNLLLLFVGWEGVGLCSYLLIGFWFGDAEKASAGKKAFVVNRIGDFGFLIGVFIVGAILLHAVDVPAPVFNFHFMEAHVGFLSGVAGLITLALFVGAMGKSAQIPLYVWLPDAMAGPTPVSALIHAATMVTAGVYMIARLHFLFNFAPMTLQFVAVIGACTAIFAALIGLVQSDIKKVLAYSTVSQLGYMFLAMGVGAYTAGIFHLMTHAFFKACLFLGSGSVIHAMSGEQDIHKMGALRKFMPITMVTFLIATLAIAGVPPFAGFFSKDEILWKTFASGNISLWILGLVAAGCTSFYMFRLFTLTFLGKSRVSEKAKAHLHESPPTMTVVLIVLAILSILGGFIGVPHALGGHNWLHAWLPMGHGEGHEGHDVLSLERWMAIASGVYAVVIGVATVYLYTRFPEKPKAWAAGAKSLYRLLKNKFYVDEIYDFLFVKPIHKFSDVFLSKGVDQRLIDASLVEGSARLASALGGVVNLFQRGLVNTYAFYFFIALGSLVLWMVIF